MDFTLDSEQLALRDEIIQFAQRELNNEDILTRDHHSQFPHDLWLKCGTMGLQGLPVSEQYGGLGLDPLTCAVALEAFGYGCRDSGLVFSVCAHLLSCVVPISRFGTDAQKEKYLPGLVDGSLVGVHAMTEPESGSDAFSLRTKAQPDGSGFRITGTKMFVTNGPVADVVIVFAASDPDKGYHGGISAFIVEKGTPGFRIEAKIEKMGLRTSPFGELVFEDVLVPEDMVLGGIGGGSRVFGHSMDWERICLFASHLGTIDRLIEQSIDYARTRTQFDQPIGKFQAVSHRIVDMKVQLEAARLLVYRAASRLDRSKTVSLDAAMVKLFVSETLVTTALGALQTFGGYGYCTEYEVERAVRDALGSTIYSGTSEMQRNIIGRWLGL